MPTVIIEADEGRSIDQKRGLAKDITDFNLAHNYIAKIGALITLIVLLFIAIKIIPEILDELYCISDLPKRKGPLEKLIWSKKQK